jgi:Icc protein
VKPTMRIAHISDLHLSTEYNRANIANVQRLLEFIMREDVDHVVITGDIAANADPNDFLLARTLFDRFGLLDPRRLTLVIGNHDIYGGVHTPEDILLFPGRCRRTEYQTKAKEFVSYFPEVFDGCLFGSKHSAFPFVKGVGDVAFIGMNSVAPYSGLKNPIGSNGHVERRQLKKLGSILGSGLLKKKRKIVLLHHHFNKAPGRPSGNLPAVWAAIERQTMKLRGKRELLQFFAEHDIQLVLHGHQHVMEEYARKGIRFVNAGGAILGPDPALLGVQFVRVSDAGIDIQRVERPAIITQPILHLPHHDPGGVATGHEAA